MHTALTTPPAVPAEPPAPESVTVAGHRLTVFVESPPLFEAMLQDIAAAKKRVWLETYIFFNDDGGKRFAAALSERARAGLDVRVFYDALGSSATPAAFFNDMAAAGVKLHAYHTFLEGLRRFRPLTILNRRNHRKLLVVDGPDDGAGYFGGMNIIDNVETAHAREPIMASSVGWRDVHLRLTGPQQAELADSFERSWSRALGRRQPRRARHTLRSLLRTLPHESPGIDESIHFFDSGPRGGVSRVARVYALLIRRAQYQITMAMAYFIPVGGVLRALLAARKRRVGIQVIVPGKSDVPLVQRATAFLYDWLIRRGFRIYERQQRMLHSKMMVVDQRYTVVGSANLDPRSLYTNLEFIAVIRSEALARIMLRLCRHERAQSQRITIGACRRIGWWQREINRLAWMLRWWL
jgi:cardiolipin synthase